MKINNAAYEALGQKALDLKCAIMEVAKQAQEKSEFCHEVTYNKFIKMLTPIQHMLHYRTYNSSVHYEPNDNVRIIEFFHPTWKNMPVCRIKEEFMCGLTLKNYYINEPFMNILKTFSNKEDNCL